MADRGRAASRGALRGGHHQKSRTGGPPTPPLDKPKREAILDLAKYVNEKIRVKFTGGREVIGVLRGYDQLLNLVLDEVEEELQEPEVHKRELGLVVLRGPLITIVSPVDGFEEIVNPFMSQE